MDTLICIIVALLMVLFVPWPFIVTIAATGGLAFILLWILGLVRGAAAR